MKKSLLVLFPLVLLVFGCKDKGPPVLRDGLFLQYRVGESGDCRLSFREVEPGRFAVDSEPADCGLRPVAARGKTQLLDPRLKPVGGGRVDFGETVQLWLPEKGRTPGLHSGPAGPYNVSEKKQWRDWDASVIRGKVGILEASWYYDTATGFMVGMEKTFGDETSLVYLLEDTNAGQAR